MMSFQQSRKFVFFAVLTATLFSRANLFAGDQVLSAEREIIKPVDFPKYAALMGQISDFWSALQRFSSSNDFEFRQAVRSAGSLSASEATQQTRSRTSESGAHSTVLRGFLAERNSAARELESDTQSARRELSAQILELFPPHITERVFHIPVLRLERLSKLIAEAERVRSQAPERFVSNEALSYLRAVVAASEANDASILSYDKYRELIEVAAARISRALLEFEATEEYASLTAQSILALQARQAELKQITLIVEEAELSSFVGLKTFNLSLVDQERDLPLPCLEGICGRRLFNEIGGGEAIDLFDTGHFDSDKLVGNASLIRSLAEAESKPLALSGWRYTGEDVKLYAQSGPIIHISTPNIVASMKPLTDRVCAQSLSQLLHTPLDEIRKDHHVFHPASFFQLSEKTLRPFL